MGMGITVGPVGFHGNGNGNVDGNWMGMATNVMEMRSAFSQWHSYSHHFIKNSQFYACKTNMMKSSE